jgi:hypothetical protein
MISLSGEARKAGRPSHLAVRPAGAPAAREARRMGRVEINIPLVTWRDGRPRFIASAGHRALGFQGQDLRHGRDGPWFTLDEAIAWSRDRRAEIEARRQAPKAAKAVARRKRTDVVTVATVVEAFVDSPRMRGLPIVVGRRRREPLAANSIRSYKGSARLLERFDAGAVWTSPADDLTGGALGGILRRVEELHGLAQTRALRALLSAAWNQGRIDGKVTRNPVAELDVVLPVLDPDVRPATVAEVEALTIAFDALGYPDVADVFLFGCWTGQRQNDRLDLPAAAETADGFLVRPSKKKKSHEQLLVPIAAVLRARRAAALQRRKEWKVQPLKGARYHLCEATQRPWKADWYRKCFRVLKHALMTFDHERGAGGRLTREAQMLLAGVDVAGVLSAAGLHPMPALADLGDKHSRDTCLTWLSSAEATRLEKAAFSGHAFGKGEEILKHYVAIPPEHGRKGLAKLEAWYAETLRGTSQANATREG